MFKASRQLTILFAIILQMFKLGQMQDVYVSPGRKLKQELQPLYQSQLKYQRQLLINQERQLLENSPPKPTIESIQSSFKGSIDGSGLGKTKPINTCIKYRGVTQSGAEFNPKKLPGDYGVDYMYPEPWGSTGYFTNYIGMNSIRVPFLLERLVPEIAYDPKTGIIFDEFNWSSLKTTVQILLDNGVNVIIDPHNYYKYKGDFIGQGSMSAQNYADVLTKIIGEWKGNEYVTIALQNEPHDIDINLVIPVFNQTIQQIRSSGSNNTIIVSGGQWDNAHNWFNNDTESSNAEALPKLFNYFKDDKNLVCEVHVYFDEDSSGFTDTCVNKTIGSDRVKPVTEWLRKHKIKGYLSEFGASDKCLEPLEDLLVHLNDNCDVWEGWTYFAAGPLWDGKSYFNNDPRTGNHDKLNEILRIYS